MLTNYRVRGLVIRNYKTDLPIKKGLSSSAAISVLTARAFNRVYDLKLTVRGEMELAYQGEITTPSRCGRMDQGCAFGNRAGADGRSTGTAWTTEEIRPAKDLHFVIVDLQGEEGHRRDPEAAQPLLPVRRGRGREGRPGAARPDQQAHRPPGGRGAARRATPSGSGALMGEAQAFFDRYATPACPEELTAPVLHRVLAHDAL